MLLTKTQYKLVEQAAAKAGAKISYEKKKSTLSADVFFARAASRPTARKHVGNHFKKLKLPVTEKKTSLSSEDITETTIDGKTVRIVYKPMSGGMTETTLNSTITELVPCLAFLNGITETNIDKLYEKIIGLSSKLQPPYVTQNDLKAGLDFIEQMPESSLYSVKMTNAMAIRKYLKDTNNNKKIDTVYWTYRAKPVGVPANSPADIVIFFNDGSLLGVSLKAGGESTKEPLLNTYVKPIYEFFDRGNTKSIKLRKKLLKEVYNEIDITASNYDEGAERNKTLDVLEQFERDNLKKYEELYDKGLYCIREELSDLMVQDYHKFADWCRAQILKQSDVPVTIIKAVNDTYREVKDGNRLNAYLSKATSVKVEISTTSKQNFSFCLYQGSKKIATMNMAVRSNKVGVQHKLGQFFNLAVKYNGLNDH
jgi:hypothetical protein